MEWLVRVYAHSGSLIFNQTHGLSLSAEAITLLHSEETYQGLSAITNQTGCLIFREIGADENRISLKMLVKAEGEMLEEAQEHYRMVLGLIYDVFVMIVGAVELHSDRFLQAERLANELEQAKPIISALVNIEPSLLLSSHTSCCESLVQMARLAGADYCAILKGQRLLAQTVGWSALNPRDQLLLISLPQAADVIDIPLYLSNSSLQREAPGTVVYRFIAFKVSSRCRVMMLVGADYSATTLVKEIYGRLTSEARSAVIAFEKASPSIDASTPQEFLSWAYFNSRNLTWHNYARNKADIQILLSHKVYLASSCDLYAKTTTHSVIALFRNHLTLWVLTDQAHSIQKSFELARKWFDFVEVCLPTEPQIFDV